MDKRDELENAVRDHITEGPPPMGVYCKTAEVAAARFRAKLPELVQWMMNRIDELESQIRDLIDLPPPIDPEVLDREIWASARWDVSEQENRGGRFTVTCILEDGRQGRASGHVRHLVDNEAFEKALAAWRCACGDPVMLADTDEWPVPCCYGCWELLSEAGRNDRAGPPSGGRGG